MNGTDDDPPVRLGGHVVFLLPASPDVESALRAVCPAGGAAAWIETANSERPRFAGAAAAYADSSRVERRRTGRGSEWLRLNGLATVYRDSAGRVERHPPTISPELVAELAATRTESGADGHYEFTHVLPGRYLLAVEIRAEFRWMPVQVQRERVTAVISPRASRTGCEVVSGA